jgi:hypothetical protein
VTGPALYGDPIDPNEPWVEAPWTYAAYAPATAARYGQRRPGAVVGATVLSVTMAGVLLITGFIVIFAASSLGASDDVESTANVTPFVVAGLLNVVAAALLIIGGVLLLGRAAAGRVAIGAATVLCIALAIFWLADDQNDNGIVIWLFIFCVPVITATLLATTASVAQWLRVGADDPSVASVRS